MGRLEEGDTQCPAIALEPMPQRCERAVGVHPLAQVRKDLLACLRAVQRFELRPLRGLSDADEVEHGLGKDGALAVESVAIKTDVKGIGGEKVAELGHPFVAALNFKTYTYTWCRNTPAQGEAGKALVFVRLERACLAAKGRAIGTGYADVPDT